MGKVIKKSEVSGEILINDENRKGDRLSSLFYNSGKEGRMAVEPHGLIDKLSAIVHRTAFMLIMILEF